VGNEKENEKYKDKETGVEKRARTKDRSRNGGTK
jgi:hypothetical protein